jgi:hypothetical protein
MIGNTWSNGRFELPLNLAAGTMAMTLPSKPAVNAISAISSIG